MTFAPSPAPATVELVAAGGRHAHRPRGQRDRRLFAGSIVLRAGDLGDTLTGSNLGDLLVGGGGNDDVNGYGGNDTIDGGAGDDKLNGADGTTTASVASGGFDLVRAGDDTIRPRTACSTRC